MGQDAILWQANGSRGYGGIARRRGRERRSQMSVESSSDSAFRGACCAGLPQLREHVLSSSLGSLSFGSLSLGSLSLGAGLPRLARHELRLAPHGRRKCRAVKRILPGVDSNQMATRWQSDGNQMAIRWQSDGNQMAISWQSDGSQMAIGWQSDGNQMAIRWQSVSNQIAIS